MSLCVIFSVLSLINSAAYSYTSQDYQLVFPKLHTSFHRQKRDLDSITESSELIILGLGDWILEFDSADRTLLLSDNFTVQLVGEEGAALEETPDCTFLTGQIHGVDSYSAVTLCGNQITGFVHTGYDLYLVQPLNETTEAHVLFRNDATRKRKRREVGLGSVCYTTEFYNLTGDTESADDDKVIELEDDEVEGNGRNPNEMMYNENFAADWQGAKIDPDELGYFYDSAWEMHVFRRRKTTKVSAPKRWLEIAIGVDYTVINFHGKNKVQRYILALMNIVSAIYQDPSLESNLQLVLTRMILYEHKKYSQIREGNAKKSLENVNAWNRKLHMTLSAGEARHDVAIWLTRADIGGPSGYAPVSGACNPGRSCTLNRDEGLTSAFIIAHEMAHVLGLTHDGDLRVNNTCEQEAMEGSVMAPMVAATFHKFSWSSCSKKEFHRRVSKWFCLKNAPPGQNEVILKAALQTSFSMDEQCRMEFGDGYKMCTAFEVIEPCSHLWCGHKDSPTVCKTKKGPPLEGTECGPSQYCLNGYCKTDTYGYQLDPVMHNPRDGGWSDWSLWGPCSKSCGFGVQFRSRFCNNPAPAYGGNYCKGDPEEFQICGKDQCPVPLQDMRAEQCIQLPKMIKIEDPLKQNMTWLPYESEKKALKCKLTCISKQTGEIFATGENLLDGTLCSYDVENDICVQGSCRFLSCNGSLELGAVEDSCGVCNGNNSQCLNLTSDFQRNVKREVSRVGVIPRQARNIKIECRVSAVRNQLDNSVFFMMRDRSRGLRYNLTADTNKASNTFIIRGAKFHYSKRGSILKLWAKGPLLEEIIVSLYAPSAAVNSGIGMTITSSYSVHKDNVVKAPRFSWIIGGWGPCSASCGGGHRSKTVACRDKFSSRIVTRRHCPLSEKPTVVTQECNTFSCRFHWVPGAWEYCTATCGSSGVQSRELYCVHHSLSLENRDNVTRTLWREAVRPDHCPQERPEIQRPCNRMPCITHWEPTEWSQCSTTCGIGITKRDFHCPPPKGEQVFSCGPKPVEQTRRCRAPFNRKNNPLCKKRRNKSCKEDTMEVCALTDYLGKYCVLPKFRKICCKSCTAFRQQSAI